LQSGASSLKKLDVSFFVMKNVALYFIAFHTKWEIFFNKQVGSVTAFKPFFICLNGTK